MDITNNYQESIDRIVLRIDRLRVGCGYSVYELSHKAELSENTLKHIYKRSSFPTLPTLHRLCNAFDIPLWQFFLFEEANVFFSKDEFELLHRYEKLSSHNKALLLDIAKNLK